MVRSCPARHTWDTLLLTASFLHTRNWCAPGTNTHNCWQILPSSDSVLVPLDQSWNKLAGLGVSTPDLISSWSHTNSQRRRHLKQIARCKRRNKVTSNRSSHIYILYNKQIGVLRPPQIPNSPRKNHRAYQSWTMLSIVFGSRLRHSNKGTLLAHAHSIKGPGVKKCRFHITPRSLLRLSSPDMITVWKSVAKPWQTRYEKKYAP